MSFGCTGSINIAGTRIKCWRYYRPHGSQSLRNGLMNSCNPVFIGLLQTLVCVLTGWIVSLITNANYISFGETLLLVVSEIPTLITSIFFGILFGTVFNDKTAPGICSIFISLAGVLGGCWMPIESMGGFETFARCLPFYPTVYLGRVITGATNVFNLTYTFDSVAKLGLIPILLYTLASVALAVILFKKKMASDN